MELCLSGVWGTVCDDRWDEASSKVVCNSLGIPGGNNYSAWQTIVSWLGSAIGQFN